MTPFSYLLQRGTAMIMAPLVLVHLAVIILAVQGGLTGEDILARTRGSALWGAFYTTFVIAAAVHAGIGIQTVLCEWTPLARRGSAIAGHLFMVALFALGARAVYAVVWA
jgi:fumarate reductase subunit C